jgi:hypothetical protein
MVAGVVRIVLVGRRRAGEDKTEDDDRTVHGLIMEVQLPIRNHFDRCALATRPAMSCAVCATDLANSERVRAAAALSSASAPLTTAEAARYCGFKTTGAIRKAALEGRLRPFGRRGGTGTYMWSREALDAFLSGHLAAGAIIRSERPGAPLSSTGGTHGNEVGQKMELVDSDEARQRRASFAERREGFSSEGS